MTMTRRSAFRSTGAMAVAGMYSAAAWLDTRVTLFGHEQAFPILLAPTSSLTHPDKELATAGEAGGVQCAADSAAGVFDRYRVVWADGGWGD